MILTNTNLSIFSRRNNKPPVPAAPVNVVLPSLTGTGEVGTVVTCNKGVWTGVPTPTYTYDFKVGGISVQTGTSNTYTVNVSDDGKVITCEVTATNSEGSASATTSNSITAGTAPVNTVAPTVSPSGTQSTGTVITANVGTWTGTPTITYEYRWTRNGSPITGAVNSTYTIQAADDGTTIRCEVRGTNAYGVSSFVASSNSVSAVNAVAPANTVAPVISGTAVVGQTLSSTTGTWTGTPAPTFSYQWFRGATPIGTNSANYTLVQADAGNTSNITCRVTATNSAGSADATSNTIAQILTIRTNAFMTASGIGDATIRGGLNTFDIGLISNTLDTKMQAVYPFVGGTANTHRWNFMDARDLDAAFRLVFSGTATHDSNGYTPNGTNGFANTFINANSNLSLNSTHLSCYSRTQTPVGASATEIGCLSSGQALFQMRVATNVAFANTANGVLAFTTTTDARGFWVGSKRGAGDKEIYRNGATQVTNSVTENVNYPSLNVYIGARNDNNTASAFSAKNLAFVSLGTGLTDSEVSTFNTLVTNLQTTLGRNV